MNLARKSVFHVLPMIWHLNFKGIDDFGLRIYFVLVFSMRHFRCVKSSARIVFAEFFSEIIFWARRNVLTSISVVLERFRFFYLFSWKFSKLPKSLQIIPWSWQMLFEQLWVCFQCEMNFVIENVFLAVESVFLGFR